MGTTSSWHTGRRPKGHIRGSSTTRRFIGLLAALALLVTAIIVSHNSKSLVVPPNISAESALVLDLENGDELASKHPNAIIYPASLTKLMTALLLAENRFPGDLLSCSRTAFLQEPTRLGLAPGATLTAAAAMDALLVGSANDVAYMIAEDLAGNVRNFAALMNEKAKSLGMFHTNFVTPHGLHDQNHYSTAKDLATLFSSALDDPWVGKSLAKAEITITASAPVESWAGPGRGDERHDGQGGQGEPAMVGEQPGQPTTFTITNTNAVLGEKGCVAGKTGFTSAAGRCLAALYERDGLTLLALVLRAPSEEALQRDVEALVNFACRRD